MSGNSTPPSGKRTARFRMTLTARTVEALQPAEKSYTAWDDKLTGFGARVQPAGKLLIHARHRKKRATPMMPMCTLSKP